MHDDTIQALDSVRLKLERAIRGVAEGQSREELDACHRDLLRAADGLRHLMFSMSAPPAGPPVIKLTERETTILRLIAEGDSSPEIAAKLSLAVPTVKTHTQHIYNKLGVNDRGLLR